MSRSASATGFHRAQDRSISWYLINNTPFCDHNDCHIVLPCCAVLGFSLYTCDPGIWLADQYITSVLDLLFQVRTFQLFHFSEFKGKVLPSCSVTKCNVLFITLLNNAVSDFLIIFQLGIFNKPSRMSLNQVHYLTVACVLPIRWSSWASSCRLWLKKLWRRSASSSMNVPLRCG